MLLLVLLLLLPPLLLLLLVSSLSCLANVTSNQPPEPKHEDPSWLHGQMLQRTAAAGQSSNFLHLV